MIIIDTDVVIDILRQHPPAIAWISQVKDPVCLPGFVVFELYQGCSNKPQTEALRKQMVPFAILWPGQDIYRETIDIYARAHLTHSMGILDALIGATAKSFAMPLHSFNAKHFASFPGLKIIQPYVR